MPTPLDPRKKPTAIKIHVSTGAGVDITWADGHASHYDFPYLREACPCATCNDEREKKAEAERKEANSPHAHDGSSALPLAAMRFRLIFPTGTIPASTATINFAASVPAKPALQRFAPLVRHNRA